MAKKIPSPAFGDIGNRNAVYAPTFFETLKGVKKVQDKQHSFPVLNHALLEFGEVVKIYATNLDDWFIGETSYNAKGEKFSVCVPTFWHGECAVRYLSGGSTVYGERTFRPFVDYIELLAKNKEWFIVEFNPKIQVITIISGAKLESKAKFKCMDAFEFPAIRPEISK